MRREWGLCERIRGTVTHTDPIALMGLIRPSDGKLL